MKEVVFKIKSQNWGMIGPNDLREREWFVYNDLTMELVETYNTFDTDAKYKKFNTTISKDNYEKIVDCLELSKQNDIKIEAYDGDAWEFIQYENGLEICKRELGYIYGIESLEEIVKILVSLAK